MASLGKKKKGKKMGKIHRNSQKNYIYSNRTGNELVPPLPGLAGYAKQCCIMYKCLNSASEWKGNNSWDCPVVTHLWLLSLCVDTIQFPLQPVKFSQSPVAWHDPIAVGSLWSLFVYLSHPFHTLKRCFSLTMFVILINSELLCPLAPLSLLPRPVCLRLSSDGWKMPWCVRQLVP